MRQRGKICDKELWGRWDAQWRYVRDSPCSTIEVYDAQSFSPSMAFRGVSYPLPLIVQDWVTYRPGRAENFKLEEVDRNGTGKDTNCAKDNIKMSGVWMVHSTGVMACMIIGRLPLEMNLFDSMNKITFSKDIVVHKGLCRALSLRNNTDWKLGVRWHMERVPTEHVPYPTRRRGFLIHEQFSQQIRRNRSVIQRMRNNAKSKLKCWWQQLLCWNWSHHLPRIGRYAIDLSYIGNTTRVLLFHALGLSSWFYLLSPTRFWRNMSGLAGYSSQEGKAPLEPYMAPL